MDELSIDEIRVLIDAMDAWEDKDFSGELLTSMLESLLPIGNREKSTIEMERKLRRDKMISDKANRKDRSVLIKAKLIMILDKKRVEEFVK